MKAAPKPRFQAASMLRFALGLVSVLAASCSPASTKSGAGQGQDKSDPVRVVSFVEARRVPAPRSIDVQARLAAQDEASLAMLVGGRLARLDVDVGDSVDEKGIIAALDSTDLQIEVERARATLATACARLGATVDASDFDIEGAAPVLEAKAQVDEARLARDRVAAMTENNVRSAAELEAAEADFAVAKSRLQAAYNSARALVADIALRRVDLRAAERRLAEATLRAPWRGRVTTRHASVGQILDPGQAIVSLVRIAPLRVILRVPELEAAAVQTGQSVFFTVDGASDQEHSARVLRLAPSIDRLTRTRWIEAITGEADRDLQPGAFCRARIVVDERATALALPQLAVVSFAGVTRVFVADRSERGLVAKSVVVRCGRQLGEHIEILERTLDGTVNGTVDEIVEGSAVIADARGLQSGTTLEVSD